MFTIDGNHYLGHFLKWVTTSKPPLNKILWIIFNPIRKYYTIAYKVPHFEMIKLPLNIENLLHFSFFYLKH